MKIIRRCVVVAHSLQPDETRHVAASRTESAAERVVVVVLPHRAVQKVCRCGMRAGAAAVLSLQQRIQTHERQQNSCKFVNMSLQFSSLVMQRLRRLVEINAKKCRRHTSCIWDIIHVNAIEGRRQLL
jgi:hypothetical protein